MHCPECGQQQISDEIRFCSRCGFPLGLVSELIANRGTLPELDKLRNKKSFISRKAGIFFGISWIVSFVLLVSIFLESAKAPGEVISFAVLFGIVTGVMMILASVFFLDDRPGPRRAGDADVSAGRSRRDPHYAPPSALPPQQSIPVQNYTGPGRWKTSDLAPASVTDNTTKLLDSE